VVSVTRQGVVVPVASLLQVKWARKLTLWAALSHCVVMTRSVDRALMKAIREYASRPRNSTDPYDGAAVLGSRTVNATTTERPSLINDLDM
jgi:hypothetical protein